MRLIIIIARSSTLGGIIVVRVRLRTILVITGLALVIAGCSDDSADGESSGAAIATVPTVLATTGIWSDIVSNVACGGNR